MVDAYSFLQLWNSVLDLKYSFYICHIHCWNQRSYLVTIWRMTSLLNFSLLLVRHWSFLNISVCNILFHYDVDLSKILLLNQREIQGSNITRLASHHKLSVGFILLCSLFWDKNRADCFSTYYSLGWLNCALEHFLRILDCVILWKFHQSVWEDFNSAYQHFKWAFSTFSSSFLNYLLKESEVRYQKAGLIQQNLHVGIYCNTHCDFHSFTSRITCRDTHLSGPKTNEKEDLDQI